MLQNSVNHAARDEGNGMSRSVERMNRQADGTGRE